MTDNIYDFWLKLQTFNETKFKNFGDPSNRTATTGYKMAGREIVDIFKKEYKITDKDVVLNPMTGQIIVFCGVDELETLKARLPREWSPVGHSPYYRIDVRVEYKTPEKPKKNLRRGSQGSRCEVFIV